jgi:endonuclease/exonuclease/phosphatase family metal-dependent hydrolase
MVMRRLILLMLLLSPCLLQAQGKPVTLRVMTYNIWYDNPDNEGNTWDDRRPGIMATLKDLEPDVLCVQEALAHQVLDLEAAGYSCYGVGRDDGHDKGEYAAIFYRKNHFEILDGGTFWLSEYPDSVGSVGWDAVLPRIASWVKLKELESGQMFHVLNTHFSHVGEVARMESVRLIQDRASQVVGDNTLLVAGDFNFRRDSEPYKLMTAPTGTVRFYDARDQAGQPRDDPGYSYVGSDFQGEPGQIIDHIFVSENVDVLNAGIHSNCSDGRCPSDHLPVIVDFQLR